MSGTRDGILNGLRWKKFPVLDQGYICLVDCMGNDRSICNAARVSYAKDDRPAEGTITTAAEENAKDWEFIRFLMSGAYTGKCAHSSPFEMAELQVLVRLPRYVMDQWKTHRTFNRNEESQRYKQLDPPRFEQTAADQWRTQSSVNKQGSGGKLPVHWDSERGSWLDGKPSGHELTRLKNDVHERAQEAYELALKSGVAREQARASLTQDVYTEAYLKNDLSNWLHFLSLRMDSHAQAEIRAYADVVGREIIAPLFPAVWRAFEDYRLNAMTLSALDQVAIATICRAKEMLFPSDEIWECACIDAGWPLPPTKCRERDECRAKLVRLGLLAEGG